MDWFGLIGLGIVVFISTNIDDIFVLMMFFSDREFKSSQVILGQYVGIGLLTGISAVGSLMVLVIPSSFIGLLGFVPLAIGVKKLFDLRKNEKETNNEPNTLAVKNTGHWKFLTVTAVTFSNGGDNLGVYVPLFANSTFSETSLLIVIFLIMVAVWCGISYYLVHHSFIKDYIRRAGHLLLPFILIGLGLHILVEAFLTHG